MIFAEPAIGKLRSFITCFGIEGGGQKPAGWTGLLDGSLGVAARRSAGSSKRMWISKKVQNQYLGTISA